jgi:radical SAM-linked protein
MSAAGEIRQKLDIVFEKEGWARFYSHHDLLRFFERALRRAELPVRWTRGFNPHPRMVFLTPLPLGVESLCEHLEIEFVREIAPAQALARLSGFMLPGLRCRRAEEIPPRRRGRQVRRVTYAVAGFPETSAPQIEAAAAALRQADGLEVERTGKKGRKRLNVAPSVLDARPGEDGEVVVVIDSQARASARPDELAAWLCRRLGGDPLALRLRKIACETA